MLLLELEDLNQITGSGRLNGTNDNDLLVGESLGIQSGEIASRLEGYGGDDVLVGSDGRDILNPGSGNASITANNGADLIYIDHAKSGDRITIDMVDTDNAQDRLIFGNHFSAYGSTLESSYVEIQNWGEEDTLVLRGLTSPNDYYYTVPSPDDLIVYVSHEGYLSVLRFEGILDVNIIEADH